MDGFRARTRYFNTYAASPLQAAAGLAVLDEIESQALLKHVSAVGLWLKQALQESARRWDALGDVRGHGLFLGVEVVKPGAAKTPDVELAVKLVNRLKDKGFLTNNAGVFNNMLKLRPPLVLSQDEAESFVGAFDATIAELKDELVSS